MRLVAILALFLLVPHLVASDRPTCLVPYAHLSFPTGFSDPEEIPLLPRYGREQKPLGAGSHAGVALGKLPADFANFLKKPDGIEWKEGTEVALKTPFNSLRGDRQRVIRHEADLAARVAAHDPGHLFARSALDAEGGVLVQEYRPGYKPLSDLRGALTADQKKSINEQIDAAVAVLSRAKVVHGDLKPDNILVDPATAKIMIIDFSVAAPVGEYPAWTGGKKRETYNDQWHSQGARGNKPAAKDDDWYTAGRVRRWLDGAF